MKAYNSIYQDYYDFVEKDGLMPLVERTIEKFDFENYREFRKKEGMFVAEPLSKYKKIIIDHIFELLEHRGGYSYSGQLCCKLTKTKCEISYGLSDLEYNGPLEYQFSTDISELRKEKIERLIK